MSGDGRLDLDDLGEVIDGATTLDEVVGEEHPTTWGERLESAGVTPWVRRHRVVVAGVAAAVVAVGAVAWVRHDPRPPDDGLAHVAVVDSIVGDQAQSIEGSSPGLFAGNYTLVRQRPDETLLLLGITGPGVRASTGGRAVQDSRDPDRTSTTVVALAGCDDPRVLAATQDQYRLKVRRTDAYGRTVDTSEPLPLGSGGRWDVALSSYCLQTLTQSGVHVDSVRASADPTSNQVALDLGLRSTLGVDLELGVVSYPYLQVRPVETTVTVPSGRTASLRVLLSVQDCSWPHLQGTLTAVNGQYGVGVEDRTLDTSVRVLPSTTTPSDPQLAASATLAWSPSLARPVTQALAAVCANLPRYVARVLSSGPAPEAVRALAVRRQPGDTTVAVVRSVVDVSTNASRVTVTDQLTQSEIDQGSVPSIATSTARTVDGVARVTVDWTMSCAGSSPPTMRLLLTRGGRTWWLTLSLDDRTVAEGMLRTCPGMVPAALVDGGWQSMQSTGSG